MLIDTFVVDELIEKYKNEIDKLRADKEKLLKLNSELTQELATIKTLKQVSGAIYLQKHYEYLSDISHQHEDKGE